MYRYNLEDRESEADESISSAVGQHFFLKKANKKTTRVRRVAVESDGGNAGDVLQGGGEVDDPEAAHDEHQANELDDGQCDAIVDLPVGQPLQVIMIMKMVVGHHSVITQSDAKDQDDGKAADDGWRYWHILRPAFSY